MKTCCRMIKIIMIKIDPWKWKISLYTLTVQSYAESTLRYRSSAGCSQFHFPDCRWRRKIYFRGCGKYKNEIQLIYFTERRQIGADDDHFASEWEGRKKTSYAKFMLVYMEKILILFHYKKHIFKNITSTTQFFCRH